MMKTNFFAVLCFFLVSTAFAGNDLSESKAKEAYGIKLSVFKSADSDFTPTIRPIMGVIFKTSAQVAESSVPAVLTYNFQPGSMKVGLLGFKVDFTRTLSTTFSSLVHAGGGICDAFVKYQPCSYFGVELGRMRGSGPRASAETGPFGTDLGDYPYISEALGMAKGSSADLRHWGINLIGRYKWAKLGFFLHNNDSKRFPVGSSLSDGPKFNRGLEFKSWDASLSFSPIKHLEFGGHLGSVNLPGMYNESRFSTSAFAYWVKPGNYKLKLDFGHYAQILFSDGSSFSPKIADPNNYLPSDYDYNIVPKTGFSALVGYHINKQFELMARYEHTDHATKEDEKLNLYTLGLCYYIPKLSKNNKITLFIQHRQELKTPIKNDLLAIQYQFVY